jgi:TonB family protein
MSALLAVAIGSALLVALGLGAAAALGRASAAFRHWVLASAIVCAAALPAVRIVAPAWALPIPAWGERAVEAPAVTGPSVDVAVTVAAPAPASAAPAAPVLAILIVSLWALGCATGLSIVAAGFVRLRQFAARADEVSDAHVRAIANDAIASHRLRRGVRLLYSARHAGVVTWGVRRPTVLLPITARAWSPERMRVVLVHELAHVRRGDWALHIVAALMCCVHWYNPLCWIAQRRLRHESERACDDEVLRGGVPGPDYASHLLAVAEEAGRDRLVWSPASAIAHASTLEERIHAMLNVSLNRQPIGRATRSVTGLGLLLLTAIVAGLGGTAAAVTASAQPGSGSIAGVFYDQHSGVLPDVEVTLTHETTGAAMSTRSDRSGAFAFGDLPAGHYTLLSKLAGFAPVTNLITLGDGGHVRRNIMLPLGTVQETVTLRSDGSGPASRTNPPVRPDRTIPEPGIASPCVDNKIGGCVKPPRKMFDVKPFFPPALAAAGIDGIVVLQARIGIDGYVNDLRLASGGDAPPHPDFVAAAIDAVRQWEFDPTRLNGVPVEANMMITVRFDAAP